MSRTFPTTTFTNAEIVAYWASHVEETRLAVDWADAEDRCWRCAYKSKLQQCHIIPDSRSGAFEPKNLVLLCDRCHKDAPNSTDPRFMWAWIRSTCVPFYETFLASRGIQEFHRMFGRYPFSTLTTDDLKSDDFKRILNEEIHQTIVHWGQGRRNPATLACIYARTEEHFCGTQLKEEPLSSDQAVLMPMILNPAFTELLAILPNT